MIERPAPLDVLAQLRLEDGSLWVDRAVDFQLADARRILDDPTPFHFTTRPRGGSKTTDLAGIAIAWLVSAEEARRYYAVAADRDQARATAGCARRLRSPHAQHRSRPDRGHLEGDGKRLWDDSGGARL